MPDPNSDVCDRSTGQPLIRTKQGLAHLEKLYSKDLGFHYYLKEDKKKSLPKQFLMFMYKEQVSMNSFHVLRVQF